MGPNLCSTHLRPLSKQTADCEALSVLATARCRQRLRWRVSGLRAATVAWDGLSFDLSPSGGTPETQVQKRPALTTKSLVAGRLSGKVAAVSPATAAKGKEELVPAQGQPNSEPAKHTHGLYHVSCAGT